MVDAKDGEGKWGEGYKSRFSVYSGARKKRHFFGIASGNFMVLKRPEVMRSIFCHISYLAKLCPWGDFFYMFGGWAQKRGL